MHTRCVVKNITGIDLKYTGRFIFAKFLNQDFVINSVKCLTKINNSSTIPLFFKIYFTNNKRLLPIVS